MKNFEFNELMTGVIVQNFKDKVDKESLSTGNSYSYYGMSLSLTESVIEDVKNKIGNSYEELLNKQSDEIKDKIKVEIKNYLEKEFNVSIIKINVSGLISIIPCRCIVDLEYKFKDTKDKTQVEYSNHNYTGTTIKYFTSLNNERHNFNSYFIDKYNGSKVSKNFKRSSKLYFTEEEAVRDLMIKSFKLFEEYKVFLDIILLRDIVDKNSNIMKIILEDIYESVKNYTGEHLYNVLREKLYDLFRFKGSEDVDTIMDLYFDVPSIKNKSEGVSIKEILKESLTAIIISDEYSGVTFNIKNDIFKKIKFNVFIGLAQASFELKETKDYSDADVTFFEIEHEDTSNFSSLQSDFHLVPAIYSSEGFKIVEKTSSIISSDAILTLKDRFFNSLLAHNKKIVEKSYKVDYDTAKVTESPTVEFRHPITRNI